MKRTYAPCHIRDVKTDKVVGVVKLPEAPGSIFDVSGTANGSFLVVRRHTPDINSSVVQEVSLDTLEVIRERVFSIPGLLPHTARICRGSWITVSGIMITDESFLAFDVTSPVPALQYLDVRTFEPLPGGLHLSTYPKASFPIPVFLGKTVSYRPPHDMRDLTVDSAVHVEAAWLADGSVMYQEINLSEARVSWHDWESGETVRTPWISGAHRKACVFAVPDGSVAVVAVDLERGKPTMIRVVSGHSNVMRLQWIWLAMKRKASV